MVPSQDDSFSFYVTSSQRLFFAAVMSWILRKTKFACELRATNENYVNIYTKVATPIIENHVCRGTQIVSPVNGNNWTRMKQKSERLSLCWSKTQKLSLHLCIKLLTFISVTFLKNCSLLFSQVFKGTFKSQGWITLSPLESSVCFTSLFHYISYQPETGHIQVTGRARNAKLHLILGTQEHFRVSA